jgi:erythromycin esterase-like protein
VEGDWPDAWRVNRHVHGQGDDNAENALLDFDRFPLWMWRNREVLEFNSWLRTYNADLPLEWRTGSYGLDLYSLYRSADAVIHYLDSIDPDDGRRAPIRHDR